MNAIEKDFINTVGCVVFDKPMSCVTYADIDGVFNLAREQSMHAMLFAAYRKGAVTKPETATQMIRDAFYLTVSHSILLTEEYLPHKPYFHPKQH